MNQWEYLTWPIKWTNDRARNCCQKDLRQSVYSCKLVPNWVSLVQCWQTCCCPFASLFWCILNLGLGDPGDSVTVMMARAELVQSLSHLFMFVINFMRFYYHQIFETTMHTWILIIFSYFNIFPLHVC